MAGLLAWNYFRGTRLRGGDGNGRSHLDEHWMGWVLSEANELAASSLEQGKGMGRPGSLARHGSIFGG